VKILKKEALVVCLSPDLITTRWVSWINAIIYYCENLNTVRRILAELDDDDAVIIKKHKNKPSNERKIAYIKSNFTILVEGINKLQTKGLFFNNC